MCLVFNKEADLSIDFLLDRKTESRGEVEWVSEHFGKYKDAQKRPGERMPKLAAKRKQKDDDTVPSTMNQVGEIVRRRLHFLGRSKIKDKWSVEKYRVKVAPFLSWGT